MGFSGSLVPLITPFNRKGRLDKSALKKLVLWHTNSSSDGIICAATTGEGPVLNRFELEAVTEICIQTAQNRIPILVATGTSDTHTSVANTEMAQKLGAAGCLVVTPYYNKPSREGCFAHFTEVAKVGLPLILYHNPSRTAVRLTCETIFQFSKIPNVVGIKEASCDLNLASQLVKFIPVFCGEDRLCYELMRRGAVGTISTTSNLIPFGWKQMVMFCKQGKWDHAKRLAKRYLPLSRALFLETNPQGVKFALSWLGKCSGQLRLPLLDPSEKTQELIKKELAFLALAQFALTEGQFDLKR